MFRYTDLFFMGAAFLLLETKSVVQFALLFGTTWFVNALVFLGVLLSVLVAVSVSKRVTFKQPARLYILLLVGLAAAWLVPADSLLALDTRPPLPRRVDAGVLPDLHRQPDLHPAVQGRRARRRRRSVRTCSARWSVESSSTWRSSPATGRCCWWSPCSTGSRCCSVAATSARNRAASTRWVTATMPARCAGAAARSRIVSRLANLSSRQKTAIVLVGLGLLFLHPAARPAARQGPPMEEGFMLVFPERVLAGDIPNRDFLHLYGPGSLWVLAAIYKVFGVQPRERATLRPRAA